MDNLEFTFWMWLAASGGCLFGFIFGALMANTKMIDEHTQEGL